MFGFCLSLYYLRLKMSSFVTDGMDYSSFASNERLLISIVVSLGSIGSTVSIAIYWEIFFMLRNKQKFLRQKKFFKSASSFIYKSCCHKPCKSMHNNIICSKWSPRFSIIHKIYGTLHQRHLPFISIIIKTTISYIYIVLVYAKYCDNK